MLDENGNEVIGLDSDGIKILKGILQIGSLFSVDASGNVTANSLQSNNVNITGGNINIESEAQYYEPIVLRSGEFELALGPNGVTARKTQEGVYANIRPGTVETGKFNGESYQPQFSAYYNGMMSSSYTYDTTTTDSPNVTIWSNGLFRRSASSSRRYKKNIMDCIPKELNPDKLYELPVRSFRYRNGYLEDRDERKDKDIIGLIVEELEEIYPIAVNHDENGYPEMWNAQILIPAMLKLIQEQNERIRKLEEKA